MKIYVVYYAPTAQNIKAFYTYKEAIDWIIGRENAKANYYIDEIELVPHESSK